MAATHDDYCTVHTFLDLQHTPGCQARTVCCNTCHACPQVGQCFTILSRPEGSLAAGKIANVLKFRVKEIDPSTGEAEEDGYEDEYQVGVHELSYWGDLRLSEIMAVGCDVGSA